MDGQLSIFDYPQQKDDVTYTRDGKAYKPPYWMKKERCENCVRWAKYQTEEQPPCGWGVKGWCNEHQHKTDKCSYCGDFEER